MAKTSADMELPYVEVETGRDEEGEINSTEQKKSFFPTHLFKVFLFARPVDWLVMALGSVAAILNGLVLAVSLLIMSFIIDAFSSIGLSRRFVADTARTFLFIDLLSETEYSMLSTSSLIPYSDLANFSLTVNLSSLTGGVIDCNAIIPIALTSPLNGVSVNITTGSFLGGIFSYYTCYDENGFIAEINKNIYILVGVATASLIFGSLQSLTFQWVANRMVKRLRLDLYKSILQQDQSWFDSMSNSVAVLSAKLTNDMDTLHTGLGRNLGNIISYLATFVAALVVAFLGHIYLTLVVLSPVPFIVLSSVLLNYYTTKFSKLEGKHYYSAGGVAEEVLSAIKTVVSLGGEYKELDRYKATLEKATKIGTRIGLYRGLSYFFIYFFLFFSVAITVWYAAQLNSSGEAGGSVILQVLFSIMVGAFFLSQATYNIGILNIGTATVDSSIDIIKSMPSIENEDGIIPDEDFKFSIEFKDVHFSYPSRPQDKILNKFNLHIKDGQRVAILGQSGSGKSTLLALLQRFYDVNQGQILIGGIDITKLNIHWLRSQMRTVLQEPTLFDTSIKENIQFGKLGATKEEVIQSAKDANIHEAIKDLPKSYTSSVGEHGGLLSGGQKQRIAIARALVGKPSLLLLDEATSALDVENEALLERQIKNSSKTVLIVTHRLPLVRSAHAVVQIEDGHVSWTGTPDEYLELRNLQQHEDDDHHIVGAKRKEPASRKRSIESALSRNLSRKLSHKLSRKLSRKNTVFDLDDENEGEEAMINEYSRLTIVKRLLGFNKQDWLIVVIVLISATFAGCGFPLFGFFWGIIYDLFISTNPSEIVNVVDPWGSAFIGLGIVMGTAYLFKTLTLAIADERLTRRIRLDSFKAMLRQDMEWFDQDHNNTGNLTYLLSDDSRNAQGAATSLIAVLWESTVSLILAYVVGFVTNWSLTLIMLVFVPFYLLSVFASSKATTKVVYERLSSLVKGNTIAIESIENIQTVKSLQLENTLFEKYKESIGKQDKWSLFISPLYPLPTTVLVIGIIVSFRYGAFQTLQEGSLNSPIDEILRTFVALIFSTVSVGVLTEKQGELYQAGKLSAKKIFTVLDRTPTLDNLSSSGIKKDTIEGKVELKNVTFAYPTREEVNVLTSFNTSVSPNHTLALIGPSGSGKSTIVSLLERFYSPGEGKVLLDNCEVAAYNVRWLRSKIGIVSQEPVLFDLTISENIRYGSWDKDVSEEDVVNAAKDANIHDFIVSTSQGYETKIGPRGDLLSGGQKQRVAIARAIVQNPPILLLDEATSALDERTAGIVQEALSRVQKGRTTILITHQLGALEGADKIVVIKRGKLVEEGSPEELLAKKGYYYNMIHNKFI